MATTRLKYECRVLPEVIRSVSYFRAMYTLNREWIEITTNRIIEAGIQTMWSNSEERALLLAYGLQREVTMATDDIIGSRRVQLLIGIVGGMGVTLAALCLLTEKLFHSAA